jgi:molybdate transport system substrate-binding protein
MAEIKVMLSLAFKEAYLELAPQFEKATGHKVATSWASTVDVMGRLKGGEAVDVVIFSSKTVDDLIAAGIVSDRRDIAKSGVAAAVKAGATKPDISSGEALKRAVLAAKSVVYSTGPSGVYLVELFRRMGISGEIQTKVKQVKGEPAGAVVARGEAELGFQQMSELLPVPGIDIVGPLSADIQKITVLSAAVHRKSKVADEADALIRFFQAPAARPVILKKGLESA